MILNARGESARRKLNLISERRACRLVGVLQLCWPCTTNSDAFHTTDHTYVLEVDRKLLLDDLTATLLSGFPVPPTSTPS